MCMVALKLCLPYLDKKDLHQMLYISKQTNADARQELRHRTRKLAHLAFECIRENDGAFVVAGSMALWLYQGSPTSWFPNDVDLFWYGGRKFVTDAAEDECTATFTFQGNVRWISFLYQCRPLVRTVSTSVGNVQFVMTSLFSTPSDVLRTFDLTCCRVGATGMTSFITLEADFDPFSFKTMCPSDATVLEHGEGDAEDLVALNRLQRLRTLRRALKYESRGLVNAGFLEGGIELLVFSILYRRPSFLVYQNNLVPRIVSDRRYLKYCSCGTEWCLFCTESCELKSAYAFDTRKKKGIKFNKQNCTV